MPLAMPPSVAANFSPAQQEGEAIFSVLENGRCELFIFV